jgi:D-alanyl-D-alanine carboxypeptidase (penicillin-binding protein 5/6)
LVEINKSSETIDKVDVWLGTENQIDVYVNEDIFKTIKKAKKNLLKVALKYEGPIEAPIKKDDVIGKFRVVYDEELIGEYDLLAAKDVDKVNVFTRLIKSLNYLIWGDV